MPDDFSQDGDLHIHLQRMFMADVGNTIPALAWRADLVKNEITFLNEHPLPGLEDSVPRLLQDSAGAVGMLAAADLSVFSRFQERLRQRQPVSEVFRARGTDGVMRWLYILGMPDPEATFCYLGLLADCTGLANAILKRGSESTLAEHVELFSNPVFMVHVGTRRIIAANVAARRLLGIDPTAREVEFAELLSENPDAYLRDVYERLLFSLSWNGLLSIRTAGGDIAVCMTRVRAYDRDGRSLLWFSLAPRQTAKETEAKKHAAAPDAAVVHALAKAANIRGLLKVLLDNQPPRRRADALMLSQIFISKGRVAVTGIGAPFESVGDNDTHPYLGSIAENLVLFDLEYILVEDTVKSIKPIDWALFIPKGIRSYLALPYFNGGVLQDVLIFCSTVPHAFESADIEDYTILADCLWAELPRVLGGRDSLAQPE